MNPSQLFSYSHQNKIDALRVSLQATTAVVLTYLLLRYLKIDEIFVGLLSAALVVEPSVGGTLHSSINRVVATLIGSFVGFVCAASLPYGYGTAVALAISVSIISFVATLRPHWRYGIVGTIAIALGSENDLLATAIERSTAIGIGASIGIIISFSLWPDKASQRAKRYAYKALKDIAQWLEKNADQSIGQDNTKDDSYQDSGDSYAHIQKAKQASSSVKWANHQHLNKFIESTHHLFNSVNILNRVATHHSQHAKKIRGR